METLYEKTAELYNKRHENDTTAYLRKRERNILMRYANDLVIDIGCGTGVYADIFSDYMGTDLSRNMILEALKKSRKNFCVADANILPFKESAFDTAICMFTVLNLCDHRKAVSEMKRILKQHGIAIVSVASVWDRKNHSLLQKLRKKYVSDVKNIRIEKNRMKFKLFTEKELIEIFTTQGFELVRFEGIYKWQQPHWNKYRKFSFFERSRLFLEKILPSHTGRIYIAIFRKS